MAWYHQFSFFIVTRRKLGGVLGTTTKSVHIILPFSEYFTGRLGRSESLHPWKKGFILLSKGAHFEKIRRRATRGEIILHFTATFRAVQHGLYTSNLLPMSICYGSENMIFILSKPLQDLDQPHFGPSPCVTGMTSALSNCANALRTPLQYTISWGGYTSIVCKAEPDLLKRDKHHTLMEASKHRPL